MAFFALVIHGVRCPFACLVSAHADGLGRSAGCEAVHECDADLGLCILPVEVSGHDALTQEPDAGSSDRRDNSPLDCCLILLTSRPDFVGGIRTISSSCPGRNVCRRAGPRCVTEGPFQALAFRRGGLMASAPRAAMTACHPSMSWMPSAVTLPMGSSAGICASR